MDTLLELPDGLKAKVFEIAEELGIEVPVVSARGCYGPCDLGFTEARLLGLKRIIHVGHPRGWVKEELPVEFHPYRRELKIPPEVLRKMVHLLKPFGEFALTSSYPYLEDLQGLAQTLRKKGLRPILGRSKRTGLPIVLGCDHSALLPGRAALLIADGKFYWGRITLEKPVFCYSPEEGRLFQVPTEVARRKKALSLALLRRAKRVGVFLSTKPGQFNLELAKKSLEVLRQMGKKVALIVGNEISETTLQNFGLEAYVSASCPAIGWDSGIPVVEAVDLLSQFPDQKPEDSGSKNWNHDGTDEEGRGHQ